MAPFHTHNRLAQQEVHIIRGRQKNGGIVEVRGDVDGAKVESEEVGGGGGRSDSFLSNIEKERQKIQKFFDVSDQDILVKWTTKTMCITYF